MKRGACALSVVARLVLVYPVAAQDEAFDHTRNYGKPFVDGSHASIEEVLIQPRAFANSSVTIEGSIGSVCQNKGCWMYVTDGTRRIRVVFKDYAFFVPMDSEGKRVRVQGSIQEKVVAQEVLRHWAEEEKGGDPENITGNQTVVMVVASSVLIEDGGDLSQEQKDLIGKE